MSKLATRGRPAYQVPVLPANEADDLKDTVERLLTETVLKDGKKAYRYHPLQIVAVIQSGCYKLGEEWRMKGSDEWVRFFRQAGDRCGNALPETHREVEMDFLKPSEVWKEVEEPVLNGKNPNRGTKEE